MLGQLGAAIAAGPGAAATGAAGPGAAGPGAAATPTHGPGAAPTNAYEPPAGRPSPTELTEPAVIRLATPDDSPAIAAFLEELAPELAHALPPASQLFLAEMTGRVAGLASWAPWDRPRAAADPRGFDGLEFSAAESPAELTLLAVAPNLRGRGIGRGLTAAVGGAAAAGPSRLLAWTLADAAIHPSSIAARAFFRGDGFVDLAVDRRVQARGEDRLLISRPLKSER
jgi:GNAT superfamily N-acetyltransferase